MVFGKRPSSPNPFTIPPKTKQLTVSDHIWGGLARAMIAFGVWGLVALAGLLCFILIGVFLGVENVTFFDALPGILGALLGAGLLSYQLSVLWNQHTASLEAARQRDFAKWGFRAVLPVPLILFPFALSSSAHVLIPILLYGSIFMALTILNYAVRGRVV
ncbi:MAG: hypothetical protein AAGE89_11615 [Pseudomonadota bacterium]